MRILRISLAQSSIIWTGKVESSPFQILKRLSATGIRTRSDRPSHADPIKALPVQMIDLFWAPRMSPKNYGEFIEIKNAGFLKDLREKGESAVFICAHAGGFEWSSLAIGFVAPAMVVTQSFKNPLLNDIFADLRQASGQRIIPQEASAVRLLKHTLKGGFAGMLIDLNLKPSQPSVVIDTFGMKMCVTFLHCLLAERAGCRLIPVDTRSLPDGTARVTFYEPLKIAPGASRQEIAQILLEFF